MKASASRGVRASVIALFALCAGFQALPARAQEPASRAEEIEAERREKAGRLAPEKNDSLERQLLILKEKQVLQRFGDGVEGFFPKFGGLETGQGISLGMEYNTWQIGDGAMRFRTSGVVSFFGSQLYDVQVTAPVAGRRLEFDFIGAYRNLSRVNFHGLGSNSLKSNRTFFRYETGSYDGTITYRPSRRYLSVGVTGGLLQTNTGSTNWSAGPSIEEIFTPEDTPGLTDQPHFLRAGAFTMLDMRDFPAGPRSGGMLRASLTHYDDRKLGRHDFQKLDLEAQQYIPFYNKRRVVALRAHSELNFTRNGQSVPFFLMPWAGGPVDMRGFRNFRFYGDNLLVLSAEYRWEAFSGLDMAIFADAGQLEQNVSDFALNRMRTSAGFGFRFNVRNTTFLRLDTGFSNEGVMVWFRFGSPF